MKISMKKIRFTEQNFQFYHGQPQKFVIFPGKAEEIVTLHLSVAG